MNWQEIVVGLLALGAAAFIALRIYRSVAAKGCEKGCGCSEIKSPGTVK